MTRDECCHEILFALQDAFPRAAIHLVAHSLGAAVILNALAPDLGEDRQDEGRAAYRSDRELRVEAVFLAGADLDARTFVEGKQAPAARAALHRAGLWWFTVPEPGRRDDVTRDE